MEFRALALDPASRTGPLKVLLLLTSLHGGGAERVAVHLLNGLDPARFDVRMGLLRAAGPYLAEADASRTVVAADGDRRFDFDGPNSGLLQPGKLLNGIGAAPAAFRAMIQEFRPNAVLSFLKGTNLIVWRALAGLDREVARPRWIAREGNNPLAVIDEETPGPLVAKAVRALTARAYRRADCVLTLSEGLAGDIAGQLRLDPAKIAWIPNPVDLERVQARASEPPVDPPSRPYILTAGRLEYQKGHDLLLRAYASSSAVQTHDLVILGKGSLDAELRALVQQLGIVERVQFAGFAANPFAWMARCDLFVLPSRWEGFGSALAEAMAAGAPVLAAKCNYGPPEIVTHEENGWLVPVEDEIALSAAMTKLLDDRSLRERLAAAGQASAQRFALPTILERYGTLLEQTAALPVR